MLATFDALLAQPLLLLVILAVGAAIGIAVEKLFAKFEADQRKAYWRGRNSGKRGKGGRQTVVPLKTNEIAVAADQLRVVLESDFQAQALLNSKEIPVLTSLDRIVAEEVPGWRVMAQVSLGEVLRSSKTEAFLAINSKRVDFLVIDGDCRPVCAFEYHGNGHHVGKTAAARDAVKQEALRKAGIGYEALMPGDRPSELRELVRKTLARRGANAA